MLAEEALKATCVRSSRASAWVLIQAMDTRTHWLFIYQISARDKTGEEDGDEVGNPSVNFSIQLQSLWGKGWSCTDYCW